jgi:predicted RNase H-like HicB family nuclease
MDEYKVFAHWDGEAGVWWAESADIKGLVAESATIEGLLDELKQIVPELLQLNHQLISQSVQIHLVADRVEGMRIPA